MILLDAGRKCLNLLHDAAGSRFALEARTSSAGAISKETMRLILIGIAVFGVACATASGSAPSPNAAHELAELHDKVEANKHVMPRFVQFINTASETLATELVSPEAIFHVPGRPEPMHGPAGYLAIIGMMRGGFPDIQWSLEEMVAEGDKVAARFVMRGTHRGAFLGVPATGKTIQVQALNIYRFSDGQIVEETGQPDMLGLLQQIGAVPPPE
jgi:steroid delta-isomerase-like uncharacterized protein